MKSKDVLEKILEETYLLSSALDVKDIDMVLLTLERRSKWIKQFKESSFDKSNAEIKQLIQKFDEENKCCIEKLDDFRELMEVELNQVKTEKKRVKQNQKIHEQYSNPYANRTVGNAFDLKK